MLVLSRKESERIRLGDSITVTVVRVAGDKVRLGIDAPPHILVLREELDDQSREAVKAADSAANLAANAVTKTVELSIPAD